MAYCDAFASFTVASMALYGFACGPTTMTALDAWKHSTIILTTPSCPALSSLPSKLDLITRCHAVRPLYLVPREGTRTKRNIPHSAASPSYPMCKGVPVHRLAAYLVQEISCGLYGGLQAAGVGDVGTEGVRDRLRRKQGGLLCRHVAAHLHATWQRVHSQHVLLDTVS